MSNNNLYNVLEIDYLIVKLHKYSYGDDHNHTILIIKANLINMITVLHSRRENDTVEGSESNTNFICIISKLT